MKPFVEDGDEDLGPAEVRWREAVEEGVRRLEKLGVHVYRRARTSAGLETTMLAMREPIDVTQAMS